MKKFKIHNNISGADFVQIGSELVMQPEYGQPDRWVKTETLSIADRERAVDTRPAPSPGNPDATESLLPSEHTIVITDVTQELREAKLAEIRRERNKRLSATDFTQLADAPLDSAQKQAMRDYRQALRDLPETIVDVNASVVWPVKPEVQ